MPDVHPGDRIRLRCGERHATAIRHAVLEAARELFIAQDRATTTVEQIALRASVSSPAVPHWFHF
jgi:AcrR family transcriptional regulator